MGMAALFGLTSGCRHSSPKNFSQFFPMWFLNCPGIRKKRCSAVEDLSSVIDADSIEQNGRSENVRTFGAEEPVGDVFAKVVNVAEKAGV